MKFNDETGGQGICQDARFRLGLNRNDTVSLPTADLVRSANNWVGQIGSWIWQASGTWEYDDSNHTDLPIATTDLVDAQQDYSLPATVQKIMRVEVMDGNGEYQKLDPIDQSQITTAMSEMFEDDGMPEYYDVIGNSLFLYPIPASEKVTLSNGLKLYQSRDVTEFTVSSTNTEPGFNSEYHKGVAIGCALDFAVSKDFPTNTINSLNGQLSLVRESINKFYGTRHNDMRPRIIPKTSNNI